MVGGSAQSGYDREKVGTTVSGLLEVRSSSSERECKRSDSFSHEV